MFIHIYQSKITGNISSVLSAKELPSGDYYFDCDSDSFLILGDYAESNFESINDSNVFVGDELLPVIAMDEKNTILMQAFTNKVALELTFRTGFAHYFSRSRNQLWKKGEESGHLQTILSIIFNRTDKFLVYKIIQKSAACHTNYYSCFYRQVVRGHERIVYKEKFNPEVDE